MTIDLQLAAEIGAHATPRLDCSAYRTIRRNGDVVAFEPIKIAIAITKAFLVTTDRNADELVQIVSSLTEHVVNALMSRRPEGGHIHIEDVQDLVEVSLYRADYQSVAEEYRTYRQRRIAERNAQGQDESHLVYEVKEKDGSVSKLRAASLKKDIELAAVGLDDVNVNVVVHETLRNIYNGIPVEDVNKAVIMAARTQIENEPQYDALVARLQLRDLAEEVFGYRVDFAEMRERYALGFKDYIRTAIKHELANPVLAEYDLNLLARALESSRDMGLTSLSMSTLYDRYFLHVDGRRIEMPQYFFMRVAMGMARNEIDRNFWAIKFYRILSSHDYMSSTPTLFNAGTLREQLSSCYVSTIGDDLDAIYEGIKENALLSKFAGGLGNDWTQVRAMGAHIKGTNGKSQGVIPFLKVVNDTAVAVNQGGKRKGAVCAYLETWHADIEEFLELRKNTGDDRRRTHDMNTANWIPDLFMKRVMADGVWSLFSPDEVPELHDTYGRKFTELYEAYEQRGRNGELRVFKEISAKTLWRKMLTMLFETGHPWITFKDVCNIRSPQDHVGVVHSSNLCFTGDTVVAVARSGRNGITIRELAEWSQGKRKFPVYSASLASEGTNLVTGQWRDELKLAVAFKTGTRQVVKVELSNGDTFRCTPDHELATVDGHWVMAIESVGVALQSVFTFSTKEGEQTVRYFNGVESTASETPYERLVRIKEVGGENTAEAERLEYIDLHFYNDEGSAVHRNGLTVLSVVEDGVEDVYDLTVEDNHNFYILTSSLDAEFNNAQGVLVHNCTEITLNNDVENETAVCNLGSVNLARHIRKNDDGQWEIDYTKLRDTVQTAVRMLDNVIDINFYPVDKARNSNLRHRPVGLGQMGHQDALLMMGLPFDSPEALEFGERVTEAISYYAIEASIELARVRGAYSTFQGSKWSKGMMPHDTLTLLAEERGTPVLAPAKETMGWWQLRENVVKYGIRNSNLMAIAPTATIANICGVTPSIEPLYQVLYVKSNLSGEFTVINEHLVARLKALGLWDADMVREIKRYEGSIAQIDRIPAEVRNLFRTSFEVDPLSMVKGTARRQFWIDQAISLNLYMAQASGKRLDELYTYAWISGLKTTYYLRTLGATSAEKSTGTGGELNAVPTQPEPKFCSIDNPDCEACQ